MARMRFIKPSEVNTETIKKLKFLQRKYKSSSNISKELENQDFESIPEETKSIAMRSSYENVNLRDLEQEENNPIT